jgi:hypothetical protein
MIGLIFPSGFSEIYVHESGYPFSIQYPSGWYIFEYPDDELGAGISIDSDKTGRNGFYITLMCSELRGDDCGQAGADYQELEYLRLDEKDACENTNFKEHHARCVSLEFIDEYAHQLDGYRAFTIVSSYTLLQDGKDPYFPDSKSGKYNVMGTSTYVLVGNDIWFIYSVNEVDKFDQIETETILSTFMINNIYAQEDIFYEQPKLTLEGTWFESLINAIMSLFGWNTSTDTTSSVVIETSMEEEFMPEQNYDWDNPIIIEMDPCSLYEC